MSMNDQEERIDEETGEVLTPSSSEVAVYSAEASQQVATARQYPRRSDPIIAREIISRATLNDEIASECVYNLPRDGRLIPGASIRFAEIVRASFGNIRVATRFVRLDIDDPQRAGVIVAAVAYDMQTNSSEEIFERRSVMTSGKGGKVPRIYDAAMIAQTAGAARSIARRNAILAVVPKALWIDGYHAAVATAKGTEKTLSTRRDAAFDAFAKLKIAEADVCTALGIKERNEVTLEHMLQLMSMWTALKEGEPIDVVLGRAAETNRSGPAPIENPLKNKPANGQPAASPLGTERGVAEKTPNEAAKRDEAPVTRQEAAGATSAGAAVEQRADQKTAQAATARKADADPPAALGPRTGAAYLQDGLAFVANATSASLLRDWWKRERNPREAAKLTPDQLGQLRDAYDEKLEQLSAE